MTPVALGLGSNKKFSCLSPEEILGGAIFELSKILHNIEISSVYRTKAMYVVDQEDFYNMALVGLLDDGICARALLEKIHEIEAAFGRDREKEIRFGPRSLDIDIEFFGRQKILEPDLQIPHQRLKERAFVLTPLLEVLNGLESKEAAQNAQSGDAQAARAANQITSVHANGGTPYAQAARAAVQATSTHANGGTPYAPASKAAVQIISTHATAWNADNIKGEIFCFGRDEISDALFSLGEKDCGVEKIIRAQDFLPFIKSRLQDGRSSR
ncbi:MAG: 2-amino-4-hydroxy-6-hydroxymethyldihydropteridine diphosphokinase [Treponemataceae bacterium]|nr:2-amino-4-hydroxy-6-hydroxymethyldihydropteridine diphosphokinase [Treponemataceae bacterium]